MCAVPDNRAVVPGKETVMAAETIQIRRYPNRRLYDRSRRQYVTLGDIEELVRTGHDVEVRDSKSDEDLTRQILTQILLERHPDRMKMFPVAMLHGILRANDLALDFLRGYLRQSIAAMESLQRAGTPFATPLDWMSAFFPGLPTARGPAAANPEAAALAHRLAELESRIERLESATEESAPETPPDLAGDDVALDRLERRIHNLEDQAHGHV